MPKGTTAAILALLIITGCQTQSPRNDWIETQLFFGLTQPGGQRISDADWHDFVDRSITPRFPDGLTILYGDGQFRGDDGTVHKEPSAILIVLHPAGDQAKLSEMAREYVQRFHQQPVLRTEFAASAAFISGTTQPGAR